MINIKDVDFNKGEGLVPAIIQHAQNGQVLMMGYMDEAAFGQTLESRKITFFSRKKKALWVKGETSGHYLSLVDMKVDCDGDTLLIQALPNGPSCHKGSYSCFDEKQVSVGFLNELRAVIATRRKEGGKDSYTARLLDEGINRVAQKVGEEATEVVISALNTDDKAFVEESADLIFHHLVLCEMKGIDFDDIMGELARRHSQ